MNTQPTTEGSADWKVNLPLELQGRAWALLTAVLHALNRGQEIPNSIGRDIANWRGDVAGLPPEPAASALSPDEMLRVARMLREHARSQRQVAAEVEAANPGDNWASLSNVDEADDADMLAGKLCPVLTKEEK